MLSRFHPAFVLATSSILALAALTAALVVPGLFEEHRDTAGPLIVYCAASQRGPVAEIVAAYQEKYSQPIEVRYGASDILLNTVKVSRQGDIFLPADESYIQDAREQDLIDEVIPLAHMNAVLAVAAGNPRSIHTWNDLLGGKFRLAQAYPAAAIGRLTHNHLARVNRWDALRRHTDVEMTTVTEVANAVAIGNIDAGIVWDVVARPMPRLSMVELPELSGIEARVEAAVLRTSKQPTAALQFARFLAGSDSGLPHFRDHGFTRVATGDPAILQPTLTLYAGAMLRPAIEETVREFERREAVKITTVFDGCGILVSAMKTRARPDIFFSCDPRFMEQVRDRFDEPATISSNQLVIAVKKGNPHGVSTLSDLGKPGLKVGVGHEQQCALGAITRETFLKAGVYGAVARNVVVQSPTGDLLVNQLLVGALDVVVAYRSNVLEHPDRLEWIPVKGIPCAEPMQPIATGKDTAYPNLTRRLVEAIRSPVSRRRFEAAGFSWKGS
jgi:molybdate transport system substrate-binding protein